MTCNGHHSRFSYTRLASKQPSLPEMNPPQGESNGFQDCPVHAGRARIGPCGPNHGAFTAKPSSHHLYVMRKDYLVCAVQSVM